MPPVSGWLVCLLFAAFRFCTQVVQADSFTNYPYQGITYITRTEVSPRSLSIHIIVVDLTAPCVGFMLTPPGGTRETIKQKTLDFLNQQGAQVAINAHFFLPLISNETNANVIGFAASQGVVYSPFEPQPIGTDYVDQSYAILPYAPALNIDPSNRASIVHLDPSFPDNKHLLEPVTIWNAVAGSAQIITQGVKSIPTYSGSPGGLNAINNYSDTNSWYSDLLAARTVIGLSRPRDKLILFTVDEAGGSLGMTIAEAADLLITDYEVFDALNLDGDASTTLALQDPATHAGKIVNNASFPFGGRLVASSLAVFAQPNTPSAMILTAQLSSTNTLMLSWPSPADGWRLQEAADLNRTNWADILAIPKCVDGRMEVRLEVPTASRFYRLTKN